MITEKMFHGRLQSILLSLNQYLPPAEAYSVPCQTSKTELFAKIVKRLSAINYFCKSFILDA